jgi:hypothetical protein
VKLRPVVPAELPAELRSSDAFRVEVDAVPGGFVGSATRKARSFFAAEAAQGEPGPAETPADG